MTDRIAGFVVTLGADARDDDAQETLVALRMVKGVIAVGPVPASVELHIAEQRALLDMRTRMWKALEGF